MSTDTFESAGESTGSIKRDAYGRYLIPHPDTGRQMPWTRATTFAKSMSDSFALSQWSQRMVAKGLTVREDLYALAAATPIEDRDTLNRISEDAKNAAGSKSGANLGTALHSFTEAVDRGESPVIPDPWKRDVAAYQAALAGAGIEVLPEYIERVIIVPGFSVAGTLDRVVRMPDGRLMIADLKTGRDLAYSWGEISVQLSLYAHATAIWNPATGQYEPMPLVSQKTAIVAHLPVGKGVCTLYAVDIVAGWQAAQLCQEVRDWRKSRDLARPLNAPAPPAQIPAPLVAVPTWETRIQAASSRAELSRIWSEANAKGEWTPALTALGKRRQTELAA